MTDHAHSTPTVRADRYAGNPHFLPTGRADRYTGPSSLNSNQPILTPLQSAVLTVMLALPHSLPIGSYNVCCFEVERSGEGYELDSCKH